MKAKVNTKELLSRLELVSKISTKHATLPALECVLLESSKDGLLLRGTNLEIGIEAKVSADVEEVGQAAVPAQVLLQTVALVGNEELVLQHDGATLTIESNGSETQIKCLAADEFPGLPKVEGGGQKLNGQMFALGIKTVAFAASMSSIKPELGSVYVYQKKEHTLTLVTTDSFRLVEKTVPQKGLVLDSGILIPHKNALELARVIDVESGEPLVKVSDNQIALEFDGGVYVTSRLVTGSFPDYEQIIPKEYVGNSTVLKEDLIHAFKKTGIFLNKFSQVGLHVTKKSITVSATSGEVGSTTESVGAESEGEELTLNFNQRYLSEALPHFVDDSLTLFLAGVGRPLVVKGVNDQTLRYLVMPMNR